MRYNDQSEVIEILQAPYKQAIANNGGFNAGNWTLECYLEYYGFDWYAVMLDKNYKIIKKIPIAEQNLKNSSLILKED